MSALLCAPLPLPSVLKNNELGGIIPPVELPEIHVTTEEAIREAHANRSDFTDYEIQVDAQRRTVRSLELSNSFNATITASIGYNQTAPLFQDVYKNLLNQRGARLDLTMPLLQWGKGSNAIGAAREDLDRIETSIELEKKTFDRDIESQVDRFLRNQQQFALSLRADTIAQKQYALATNRYKIGKYDVTKLLISQEAKDRARQDLMLNEENYWLSYFRLRRLTLFDFAAGKPVVYSIGLE